MTKRLFTTYQNGFLYLLLMQILYGCSGVEDIANSLKSADAPEFSRPAYQLTIAESTPDNTPVFDQISATDPDGDILKYTIVSGNDDSAFHIDSTTAAITVLQGSLLDYETAKSRTLGLEVKDTDGNASTALLKITLTDVDEAPVVPQNPISVDIAEDSLASATVLAGNYASDPEKATLKYSIVSGNTGNIFLIDTSTGEITLAQDDSLDFETRALWQLVVAVNDGQLSSTVDVNVNVTDVVGLSYVLQHISASNLPGHLAFDWYLEGDRDPIDHYAIEINPNSGSGFSDLAGHELITTTHRDVDIPLHLTRFDQVSYQISTRDSNNVEKARSGILDLRAINSAALIDMIKSTAQDDNDQFGAQVVLSGDGNTLAIGVPGDDSGSTGINGQMNNASGFTDSGAVYVYTRNTTTGRWELPTYIKPHNTQAGDYFGTHLAISDDGNRLAVSATGEDSDARGIDGDGSNNNRSDSGAVYLFERNNNTWQQRHYIKASNADQSDYFGVRLAFSGDGNTLAVAAMNESSSATGVSTSGIFFQPGDPRTLNDVASAGAVYLFENKPGGWQETYYVKPHNTAQLQYFGYSLALSLDGHTLAVGAPQANNSGAQSAGAAYVFQKTSSLWAQQAFITRQSPADHDQFGTALALSDDGNTLAVAAPYGAIGSNATGDVAIYRRNSTVWSLVNTVSGDDPGDAFGSALSLSADGKILAVGIPRESSSTRGVNSMSSNENNSPNAGRVDVFSTRASDWSVVDFLNHIKASNTGADDRFGNSVSLSNDGQRMAVGACNEDTQGTFDNDNGDNTGAVYMY